MAATVNAASPSLICTLGSAAWPESGITVVLWVVFSHGKSSKFIVREASGEGAGLVS